MSSHPQAQDGNRRVFIVGRAESIISASYDPLTEPPGEYYNPLEYLPNW